MASNARCIFFLLLTLSLSFQTHARDSKFFSKVSKKSHEESISVAPAQAPTLSPSPSPEPEPQVIEHGYGLYGQEASYTPPTTKVGGEGEQDMFELSKNNYFNEKQGMSDTRFLENGKYYYNPNHDNNVKDQSSFFQNNNDSFEEDNNEEEEDNSFENENNEDEFEDEDKKNGRYHQYGHNNARFEVENNENENLEAEKRGMSDTRFLENGKYYYDVQNDKYGNNHMFNNLHNNNKFVAEDVGFHSSNNVEYANTYNGYETQGRGGYNDNHNVKPKKFANVYDSMEEYDREQGYIDGQDNQYVP